MDAHILTPPGSKIRSVGSWRSEPRHHATPIRIYPYTSLAAEARNGGMKWQTIHLELGCTSEFPRGSPSRCHLLRLPLDGGGLIDEGAVRCAPLRATARRFWPSQPDMSGYVLKIGGGWTLSYVSGEEDEEIVFRFEAHSIRMDELLYITEPDGQRLPFRVASLQE